MKKSKYRLEFERQQEMLSEIKESELDKEELQIFDALKKFETKQSKYLNELAKKGRKHATR